MKAVVSGRGVSFRAALCLGAAPLVFGLPSVAFAQDDTDASEAYGNQIVVTATKREQTLQDTPVAVSVTTGAEIERAEIRDIKDLQMVVPSLKVTQLQSSANTNFIIRGFGNGANNAGIEPSVGVFVDGVYRSRTASRVNDLPGVQRIEVLRGPQSTLFGKNASAGVISIITQEPQFTPGGSLEASYGNYDALVLKGYVTGPVSDSVALSLGAGYNTRDGYFRDLGTGGRTNERDRWFVRGQMLFEPTSDLRIRIIGDYDEQDEDCCGVVNLQPSTATLAILALGGQINDPTDRFANVVYNNFASENKLKNWGISGQIDYDLGGVTLTSITSYRESRAVTAQDPDFTSADLIYPIAADVRLDTFTQELRFAAEIGERVNLLGGVFYIKEKVDQTGTLTWGSDTRGYADFLIGGLTGGTMDLITLEGTIGTLHGDVTQYLGRFYAQGTGFAEAFTLNSEAVSLFGQMDFEITDGLTLTLGGNYTHDSKRFTGHIDSSDVFSAIDLVSTGNTAIYLQGIAVGVGEALSLGRPATQDEINTFIGIVGLPTFQALVAAPAQAYADANDTNPAVNPFLGLQPFQFLPPFLNLPNSVENGRLSDDDFSYTIRLAYDLTPDVNVYASYATGFKAGSVNLSRDSRPFASDAAALGSAGLLQPNQTFGTRFANPEKARVIEAGVKGNWGSGSANVAVFKQTIREFQSNIFTGSGFALANAGKQSTFGVEFEGRQEIVPGLVVNLGVTYLDPVYNDFVFSAVGDLSGTTPAGIPEWTVVLGGNYTHEFGSGDRLILNANYHHESRVQIVDGLPGFLAGGAAAAIAAAAPYTRQVDELDASITYALDMGLEFSLWGRNLLNDRYLLSIFDSVAQPLSISGYPNQPRTWGGTVRFKW